jgi:hypothetical protein
MGSAIGAVLVAHGHEVLWQPNGRSEAIAQRAAAAGLTSADSLLDADVILSVGPPPRRAGTTRLYLSGRHAIEASRMVAGTHLEPVVLERFGGIYDELTDPPFIWRQGFVIPSERPGLGHILREDVARSLRPESPGRSLIRSY